MNFESSLANVGDAFGWQKKGRASKQTFNNNAAPQWPNRVVNDKPPLAQPTLLLCVCFYYMVVQTLVKYCGMIIGLDDLWFVVSENLVKLHLICCFYHAVTNLFVEVSVIYNTVVIVSDVTCTN